MLLPATGAHPVRRASSLPGSSASSGSWRRSSWSLRSSYPRAMPVIRCATSVRTECSVRQGSRWSVKLSATRSKSPVARSACLSSNAPAFDVIRSAVERGGHPAPPAPLKSDGNGLTVRRHRFSVGNRPSSCDTSGQLQPSPDHLVLCAAGWICGRRLQVGWAQLDLGLALCVPVGDSANHHRST